jgi:Domain of unknown function (DUF6249)
MEVAVVVVALLAFFGFRQWLQHQRRLLAHRERIAAIEKGVELPPLEQETKRSTWNVQRILLLAGLTWIAIGIGAYVVLSAILAYPSEATKEIPKGLQTIGVAPVAVGIAHLITYWVGERRER